jgi:hypothetical protein
MRLLPVLLFLPLLALQAHAQTAPPPQSTPAPSVAGQGGPATGGPAPNALAPATPEHHRMTWQQRFAQANLTHDGHLTAQEASGGYPSVARHFTEIDADKKGYVTEEDITNWHKLQRAMHHSSQRRSDDGLRPRPAIQRGAAAPRPINTSTNGKLLPMAQPDASPAGQQATAK